MKESKITGTIITFTSHNKREEALKRIIEADIKDAKSYIESGNLKTAERLCEEINARMAALYYLSCTENIGLYLSSVTKKIEYRINEQFYEMQ